MAATFSFPLETKAGDVISIKDDPNGFLQFSFDKGKLGGVSLSLTQAETLKLVRIFNAISSAKQADVLTS